MAVPKRKVSKTRKRKRRTHWKAETPSLSRCSQCHQPKLPHTVCQNCGYYGGREVVTQRKEGEE